MYLFASIDSSLKYENGNKFSPVDTRGKQTDPHLNILN